MTPERLINLAQRAEAAAGPDRLLDLLIGDTIAGDLKWQSRGVLCGAFSGSLDAALTVVPADAFWRVGHDGDGPDPSQFRATVSTALEGETPFSFQSAVADTAPLALCAAALRARAAMGDAA